MEEDKDNQLEAGAEQRVLQLFSTVFRNLGRNELSECWEQLVRHCQHFLMMDWDQAAVNVYGHELLKQVQQSETAAMLIEQVAENDLALQTIGSPLYERLFNVFGMDEVGAVSEKQAKKRLALLLKHLGGEMDENEMLQLNGKAAFDDQLAPHAIFWSTLAETVQAAYPVNILSNRSIHQLRMYIDRQNISYVRSNFKKLGMTDEQALAAYVKAPTPKGRNGKRIEREPARYHNKLILGENYSDRVKGNENKKRTVGFHSEFIIDPMGNFVSQWNVLEKDSESGKYYSALSDYQHRYRNRTAYFEEQLMNGESFNYANRNDETHVRLDVKPPAKLDTRLRKDIGRYGLLGNGNLDESMKGSAVERNQQNKWFSPKRKSKDNSKVNYDYLSDKGDAYSGRLLERLMDQLYKVIRRFKLRE